MRNRESTISPEVSEVFEGYIPDKTEFDIEILGHNYHYNRRGENAIRLSSSAGAGELDQKAHETFGEQADNEAQKRAIKSFEYDNLPTDEKQGEFDFK
ncbi:hypothetical protein KKA15_05335 [Patescibacteria group bacterium]|nr:hypothetical protein [Patescibacteria group bacterium]